MSVTQDFLESILFIFCAYNNKPEKDGKCHNVECMLAKDLKNKTDIQGEKGCVIFKQDKVKKVKGE